MEFERSTQAHSWLFDQESLHSCRQQAVTLDDATVSPRLVGSGRVRKFASGYHAKPKSTLTKASLDNSSAVEEQEQIVQFHSHQMQSLIGPSAVLPDLRTSEVVLATGITFFRRFYLSNSVVDVSPRKIAVASAFLAAKVEEEKVEIESLARATALVQMHVQNAPLCSRELRAVSANEIQYTELLLIEGLNYQFRCYHPCAAIDSLITDVYNFQQDDFKLEEDREPSDCVQSPRSTASYSTNREAQLRDRACEIASRSTIFSDALFLYTPCHIALAILSIVTGCVTSDGSISWTMQRYLSSRFDTKDPKDVARFSNIIREIILMLANSPGMELQPPSNHDLVSRRAEDLRRVLEDTASRRMHRRMQRLRSPRKRSRMDIDFTPPRRLSARKHVRVTPTGDSGY